MAELELKIAAFVFIFLALLHAARVFLKVKVTVGKFVVPLWLSLIGIIVALLLAGLMLRSI